MRSLIGIVTISILSRYLTPAEFGMFSLIFLVIIFSQIFADFGLRVSLVQRPEVTEIERNSVFWTSVAFGTVIMLAVFFSSDFLAGLFKEPELARYLRYISPLFLIISAQGVSMSVLERGFQFPRMATAELSGSIAGAVTAIFLAMSGATVMALVMQQIVVTVVVALMTFYFARWLPRFSFSLAALKPLVSYGSYVTAAAAVQTAGSNADRPIVGTRISPQDLGFLTISQQIVFAPIRTIVSNIRKVSFPIMATIQHDNQRMWQAYLTTLHALILVMAPICLGICALAVPITDILLGKAWAIVANLLGFLTIAALFQTIEEMNAAIFGSKGQARFLFRWHIFAALVNICMLLALAPYGIIAIVMGKLAVNSIIFPVQTMFLCRLLEQKFWPVVATIWKQMAAAALMAILVRMLDNALAARDIGAILRIAIGAPVGAMLYIALMLSIDRERSMALARKIRNR